MVVDGIRTLGRSRVLLALVLVEVFWSVGMIAFETFMPVRLAELVGGENEAGALMGPVSSAAWGLFAVGSFLAGLAAKRIGVGWTALVARVLNGAFVVVMGLMLGPVGLITAFLVTYTLHGSGGPVHSTLLHRQAEARNRTTVLSMNSMIAGGAYSIGLLVLGPLAEHTEHGHRHHRGRRLQHPRRRRSTSPPSARSARHPRRSTNPRRPSAQPAAYRRV